MTNNQNNKRIAKNTLMLYSRQIFILFVSLYSIRVVLNVLGIEDYGIYTAVGGIVSFFSFLNGTMASATQRFFSFALGQNNPEKLKITFTVNWLIYAAIAIIAVVLLETAGLWFVNEQLKLPNERFEAAQMIYHYSVLTFVASIITTPFIAIIIAHEDMHIYTYVSIIEVALKLAVLFLLMILPWDKLESYALLIFLLSVVNVIVYLVVCITKYKECQFRQFYWDKGLLHEITGFTGWTLFGQVTTVVRNQAVTILINQMFTPVLVAARAIAINMADRINVFSNSFNIGLYPPIIKSYAADDKKNMFSLVFNGSKITFFLMWVFALPIYLEMDTILTMWLKNPPPQAVLFTRLALIEVLINSLSLPITTAARAPGKMKIYELTLGSIQLAIFFVSWLVLKLGGAAYSVFIVAIVANLIMFFARLYIVRSLVGISIIPFSREVVFPVLLVILFSSLPSLAMQSLLPEGLVYTCIFVLSNMILTSFVMYFFGLNRILRENVKSQVRKLIAIRVLKYYFGAEKS